MGRSGKAALGAAFFFGVAVTTALLVPLPFIGRPGIPSALVMELENFCHPVLFAAIAFLLSRTFQRLRPNKTRSNALVVAIALLGYGAGTELLQAKTGRDASWGDFLRDGIGIGIGLCLFALQNRAQPIRKSRFALKAAVMMGATAAALPLLWTSSAYTWRSLEFPLIWRRNDPLLTMFGREEQGGDYPGLAVVEPVRDWRGFRELLVILHNSGDSPARFVVRVADLIHDQSFEDRYNGDFELGASRTSTVRIPLATLEQAPTRRNMDLSHISDVLVFQRRAQSDPRVEVLEIRLAR